jgi:hypothetical protein
MKPMIQKETALRFLAVHSVQGMELKDVPNASKNSAKIQEEFVSVAMFQTASLVECRMFAINATKTIRASFLPFLVINVFYVIKVQLVQDAKAVWIQINVVNAQMDFNWIFQKEAHLLA